jgi:hypothetical protein
MLGSGPYGRSPRSTPGKHRRPIGITEAREGPISSGHRRKDDMTNLLKLPT